MSSSIASRANADVIESLYLDWKQDPESVDSDWSRFFEGFELGMTMTPEADRASRSGKGKASSAGSEMVGGLDLATRARIVSLVYTYRALGHMGAHLDPLENKAPAPKALRLDEFGLLPDHLDEEISTQFYEGGRHMPLRELVDRLSRTYCQKIGFEYMHIQQPEVRNWIRERIEPRIDQTDVDLEKIRNVFTWLTHADGFEQFLHRKYVGQKRFSLEGGDSLMVSLNGIFEACPDNGISQIVMGMAHRGRLNVLANFLNKPLSVILYEFTENYVPNLVAGDGDVKYHLGFDVYRKTQSGDVVDIHLGANPSHLEAVNGVVEGKARAKQRLLDADLRDGGVDRRSVLPILIHGDAAFAGQGSVAETLNLSQLKGYRTGGTIHIVINNQIGFTTTPEDARSSHYCTDVAKMIDAPIFHVNGDSPLDVLFVSELAARFRQTFRRDVVIDIVCYRRHGHNEGDEPAFTLPKTYQNIRSHDTPAVLFREEMIAAGNLTREEATKIEQDHKDLLENQLTELREAEEKGESHILGHQSSEIEQLQGAQPEYTHQVIPTGYSAERLVYIGTQTTQVPEGVNVNRKLAKRFLGSRAEAIKNGNAINWAFAESLAFGSLLDQGNAVRLSGQDCRRGTFSQRHAVLYDPETRERYTPLNHIEPDQKTKLWVYNSLLSEFAVLGYEYGYSALAPDMLVLWEAQFGDFVNGAQVIIDQFICSAESKWQRICNLVMLLPHGYEGQGPEHSSARLERFLQLAADNNMIICNLTTPAQYFHVLRRQIVREDVRKPLILMTPKSLLNHPECVSTIEDMAEGTHFHEIFDDHHPKRKDASQVNRVIFCSGKVYYDLAAYREQHEIIDTAIIRVEQLYPYDWDRMDELGRKYKNASKWVWCQEEPLNMGAWTFIWRRIQKLTSHRVRYAGREPSASTATGSKAIHKYEQQALVQQAFNK
ncbi:MAG: 2-oxoglutarate dehydrogenase E1 component [Verrucomicrobiales bacterium]|nr:2-oxoglutarate dehydrogenase E1 component [Verrucomicrobiales bacterium]